MEANTLLDISKLSAEQLKQLKAQLNAQRKTVNDKRGGRYAITDAMLKEKDENGGFKHTTGDILAALQAKSDETGVPTTLTKDERAEWLKKIQTRKQYLEKLTDEAGNLVHAEGTFGYKPSAGGFTALTPDRVVDWLLDDANVEKLTPADRKAILKALKA
jgi:hypothetical protein